MCTVTGPRRMTSLRLIKGVLKVLKVFEIQFYIVLAFRIESVHNENNEMTCASDDSDKP